MEYSTDYLRRKAQANAARYLAQKQTERTRIDLAAIFIVLSTTASTLYIIAHNLF